MTLAQTTGLDQKQISNWFINQRKRHWKPTPVAGMTFPTVEAAGGGFRHSGHDGGLAAAAAAADAMSPMQVRIGGVLESFSFFVHHHCIALFRFGDG